ncbi:hypothetical protein [Flavonifractor sp. An82]|uniref:hypothetical protein n=1 Tax=Flavonifractor sp. An82 TaxID=1965660 RepID=UPI0011212437|nr:hypothetical protein [Flavonifractor sp. An82]
MEKGIIKIGKPYVIHLHDKGTSRLCADVEYKNKICTLYYETDEKYSEYYCYERSDAFILGLLHSAMYNNENIICEAPITEQLYFQLSTYYIPIVAENMPDLNTIEIIADKAAEIPCIANASATGNSGGVDSFYTMLKYTKERCGNFGLTHVMFNNISSNDNVEDRIRALFNRDKVEKERISEELGYEFVWLFTNLYSFYETTGLFNHYFTLQYISAAYALKKLFAIYYFSSTFTVDKFSIDPNIIVSGGRFDLFTLAQISVENLKIYSAGMEAERLKKVEFIDKFSISHRHLQVCAVEQSLGGQYKSNALNCGYCHKCRRMISLYYAWGVLEKYQKIFDLSYFNANKSKFIGCALAADQKYFAGKVKNSLKKEKKYTLSITIWYLLFKIRYSLAKNKKLVRIYYKLIGKELTE